jgi:hypothetical protein
MKHFYVQQIAFYKSTNVKILLNVCSNWPTCGQTCPHGTRPSNVLVINDCGDKKRASGSSRKVGGNDKRAADRHGQQSILSGNGNDGSNGDGDVDGEDNVGG